MANQHYQALLGGLQEVMEQGKYSDLTIVCEDREWPVHKAIICSASPILAKECDSKMIEGISGRIEHNEFDAVTIDRMICYIYKRKYDVTIHDNRTPIEEHLMDLCDSNDNKQAPGNIEDHGNRVSLSGKHADADLSQDTTNKHKNMFVDTLIAHTNVYRIGDYYKIPTLKIYAAEQFNSTADANFTSEGFSDVVKAVLDGTSQDDKQLRDILRHQALKNLVTLISQSSLMKDLLSFGDAQDLVLDMIEELAKQRRREIAQHGKALEAKDREIKELQGEVQCVEYWSEGYKRGCEFAEEKIGNLADAMKSLAPNCNEETCNRTYGPVTLQLRVGNTWGIKCTNCNCDLVDQESFDLP